MKRQRSIELLLATTKRELDEIKVRHDEIIKTKKQDDELMVKVCDYLQHHRQILDYIAREISGKCVIPIKQGKRSKKKYFFYFPLPRKNEPYDTFKKLVVREFPGLEQDNKDIFNYLLNVYKYVKDNSLYIYSEINNTNKHDDLLPHLYREENIVGSFIHIPPGSGIDIPDGCTGTVTEPLGSLQINGPFSMTFTLSSQDLARSGIPTSLSEWFAFETGTAKIPVMELLEKIKLFTFNMFDDLKKII